MCLCYLLTLFPLLSLQLLLLLIHSSIGVAASNVDLSIGMKGDLGSPYCSAIFSTSPSIVTKDLAEGSSMGPRKEMKHWQATSPVKSGYLHGDMYDYTVNPVTQDSKCFQDIVALQEQLRVCKEKMEKQKADLRDALKLLSSVKKEKLKVQERLEDTEAKLRRLRTTNKLDVSLPIKKDLKELLESQAKTILWGMVKFIQCPADELMAARILVKCADNLPEENVATKEDRNALATTYKSYIRRAIFQRRNYVHAEHKKVMMKRYKDKGCMPTVSQLVKCLKRDIASDEEYDTFQFYWEELLPKQVGSCCWSKDIRNYTTICEAIRKDITHMNMPMITSEDEAFTVLVVENSYDRWMTEIQEDNIARQQGTTKLNERKPNYNGRYSTTDSGQNEWGGWTEEGLAIFNGYVDSNREARKKITTQTIERNCLARIKQKYNIVCNDHKTQTDLNKKRKRKVDNDKPKMPPLTIHPEFHHIFLEDDDDDDVAPSAIGSLDSSTQSKS
jgi:hypothetical protein